MREAKLQGARILVVEDQYMLADELCTELLEAGAQVVGPAASVADAFALIAKGPRIDGAILDVNLRGEMIFPVADLLAQQRTPFVFTTGYDSSVLPSRFDGVARCEKPVDMPAFAEAIGRLVKH